MRGSATFAILIESGQLEKMKRVVNHNGGVIRTTGGADDRGGLVLTIGKSDSAPKQGGPGDKNQSTGSNGSLCDS